MTSKKNQIRVINDLELKDVSGGFVPVIVSLALVVGIIVVLASAPKSRGGGS